MIAHRPRDESSQHSNKVERADNHLARTQHTQSSVNILLYARRAAKQPHLQFDVSDAKLISRDEHRAAGHTYIITATQW